MLSLIAVVTYVIIWYCVICKKCCIILVSNYKVSMS